MTEIQSDERYKRGMLGETPGIDQEDFANSINVLTKKITDTEAPLTAEIVNRHISDPQIRRAILSEMRWVAAVLREESGAAISLGEYTSKGGAFFPRAGDDIGTIQDKERARGIELEGLLGKVGASGQRKLDEQSAARQEKESKKQINELRKQLQNPTPEQKKEIEQARSQIDNLNSTLVLRDGQFTELFPGDETLPTDIEL